MQPAPSIEAMATEWLGRYYLGRRFLLWSWDATLGGGVYWDSPDLDDIAAIARIFVAVGDANAPPSEFVHDASRLGSLSPEALAALLPAVRYSNERNDGRIRRQAIVAPAGLWGVLVAGVLPSVGAAHPWRLFAEPAAAFAWLGRGDAEAARTEVEALVASALAQPPVLRALRGYLAAHLASSTLDAAARALATSPRSLQRDLSGAGTSFQRELDAARVRAAIDLVNLTERKLEAIAAEIGLSSVPKLNDVFRRAIGVTPGELRARRG